MKTGSQLKRSGFKKKIVLGGRKPRVALKKHSQRRLGGKNGAPRGVYAAKLRAWIAFSKFIRQRDKLCITSGHPTTEAGHYHHNTDKPNKTLGGNELWYDERNVSGQCAFCNRWKDGNLAVYAIYLEEKHGAGILQELNTKFRTGKKWTIEEIEAIAVKYTALLAAPQSLER